MNCKFWKKYTCNHDWEHVRNLHGDEINSYNGVRSIWKCPKCGKYDFRYYIKSNHTLKDELQNICSEFYDKRYGEWKDLRSETLNLMLRDMRNTAYRGLDSYEIILNCDEDHNDKLYYDKWFKENGLTVTSELYGQKEVLQKNSYLFKISWK